MQFAFDPLTPADITCYFRSTDDFSCAVSHWGNCQCYLKLSSIFSQTSSVEMIDPLALADSRKDSCFLLPAIEGNDHQNRPAYGFFGCVSKESLGTCVPTSNDAV